MNDLAHFQLAAAEDGWLVGALLGDHVKGVLREADWSWPASWLTGVRLHRRVDAVTDRHPALEPCRASLPAAWRRYAGIILDVSLDHWLACHWSEFNQQPLAAFEQRVYRVLAEALPVLPDSARRRAESLVHYQPLADYRQWAMVPATMERIARRLSRSNPLPQAAEQLLQLWPSWEEPFAAFYTDLPRHLDINAGQ